MSSSGPRYPTAASTTSAVTPYDDNDWVDIANVKADDGSNAYITDNTYDANDYTYLVKCQGFGFEIPAGATVDGIVVEVEGYAGNSSCHMMKLLNASGTAEGDNNAADGGSLPTSLGIDTFGGAADKWGVTLTPTMVNDADFGVQFAYLNGTNNADIFVDYLRMTVYYTAAAASYPLSGTVSGVSATSGAVRATRPLGGSAVAATATESAVTAARPLTATVAAQSASTTAISAARPLSGTAAGVSAGSAAILAKPSLAGTVVTISGSSASILAKPPLSGAVGAISGGSADIGVDAGTSSYPLSGTTGAESGGSAMARAARPIAGVANALSATSADVGRHAVLSGTVAAESSGSCALTATRTLSGTTPGVSSSSAAIGIVGGAQTYPLSGQCKAVSGGAAVLTSTRTLGGIAAAACVTTVGIQAARPCSGTGAALSGGSASIRRYGEAAARRPHPHIHRFGGGDFSWQ